MVTLSNATLSPYKLFDFCINSSTDRGEPFFCFMSCRGRSHKIVSAYRNCLKDNGIARTALQAAPRQIHVYTFKCHWLIVSNLVFYAQSAITVISGRYSLINILV